MGRIKNWLDCWRAKRQERAYHVSRIARIVAACEIYEPAFFESFDEALADVGQLENWPEDVPKFIKLGGNLRVTVGKTTVSCCRDHDGRYERPLVY